MTAAVTRGTRRSVLSGAAALSGGVVAACGGPEAAGQAPAGAAANASGNIRFSFFGSVEEKAVWEKIAQQFVEKTPAVKVEAEHIPSDYFTKVQTAIAGGDAADVILMEDKPTSGYAKKGFFRELDSYLAKDASFKLSDYYAVLFDGLKYRGKLYGPPLQQTYLHHGAPA